MIKYIPKDRWFSPHELPSPVSRNEWVCKRLEEEGVLRSRVEWRREKEIPLEDRTDFSIDRFYIMPS
jgi:hypothetical protein